MESFFVRVMVGVMTNEKVQTMLHSLIHDATKDVMDGLAAKLDATADHLVDRVDGLDGRMGNLQEQFTAVPGQIIGGVIDQLLARLPHLPWM